MLRVRLLGQFSLELNDEPVELPSRPAQSLLAYLVLNAGVAQRREKVAGLFWPESTEANARSNLRHALWRLRKALGTCPQTGREYLDADDITITFDASADYWLDAAILDRKADEGGSADDLIETVSVYGGELLPGFYEDWVTLERERLQAVFERKMQLLLERLVEAGRWLEVLEWGERWIALGHTPEPAYRALMVAHNGLGDLASAAAVYQRCVQALRQELGVEPSKQTQDLYERIRAGEFQVGVPTRGERVIRGYELRERIGAGGFGVVYRAYQPVVGREVAVKIILPEYANHPDFIRRFETEAQLVARLEHLHIVPLYDYWREPDGAYLVMRWLRGGNLRGALHQGPWMPEAAARLLDQLAGALAVAHRQNVVHRDVKPENILLDEQGNGYLSDFGIAKDLMRATRETEPGAIVGSPSYISPEQARGGSITPQSDLYSLGVVMYQVLTGEHPFSGITPAEQLIKHLTEPLPSLRERRPDLPEGLEEVIQRATAKDLAQRYPDALAFALAFREAVSGPAAEAAPPPPDWAIQELVNPYKGLRPFEEADAADFFGREALTEHLLARLNEGGAARFLAVVGPSGSGKSSVVKAGLVPALRQGALPGSEEWMIVEMFPGAHPLEELEAALLRVAVNPPPSLIEQLQKDAHGLLRAVKRTLPPGDFDLLLVIDQFEELFTLVDDDAARRHLMDSLLAAVADPRSRLRVVLTLRADFYDRPLRYAEFGELLCANMETVMPLSSAELERAICGPAERVGASLEPGLAAVIVAEVNEQPGALPMLQYALTELFERREGRLLIRSVYEEIGGVMGALARRAEEVYGELDATGQTAARQLFLRLATLGEGVQDTRRRVLRSELMAIQTSEVFKASEVLGTAIQAFGQSRLLLFDRDPATRAPTVEVAHEALLREWPRLRGWLDESRADVRMQRILGNAAAEWEAANRDPSFLLRGARLSQFEEWMEGSAVALTQDEHAYLQASLNEREARQAQEQRRRNVLRALRGVAAVAAVVAFVLAGVAINQRQDARRQASIGLGSQAVLELQGSSPERAVPLALEALENYPYTWQAERALSQAALGSRIHSILPHGLWIRGVWWSPDETLILTGGVDGTAKVWDASTGEEILTLAGHKERISHAAWSPSGDLVVTTSRYDDTARVWDVSDLRQPFDEAQDKAQTDAAVRAEAFTLSSHTNGVFMVTWLPSGDRIATTSLDGTAKVWDAATGEILLNLVHEVDVMVNDVEWSPDEAYILTSSDDRTAIVWDAVTGEKLLTLEGHEAFVQYAAWSPSGDRIVTGSGDDTAKVWDVSALRQSFDEVQDDVAPTLLFTLSHPAETPVFVAWSPSGDHIATIGGPDSTAKIWDANTGANILTYFGHEACLHTIAWSPDGSRLATGSLDGMAKIWDATTGREIITLLGHAVDVTVVAWSPSGDRLATGSMDGTVIVWGLDPTLLTVASDPRDYQFVTAWSPQGDRVAREYDGGTKVWDISDLRPVPCPRSQEPGEDSAKERVTGKEPLVLSGWEPAWSPSGDRILTVNEGPIVRVWDATSGKELDAFTIWDGPEWIFSEKWSPDGTRIAVGTAYGPGLDGVGIFDADTGKMLVHSVHKGDDVSTDVDGYEISGEDILTLSWSPDGTAILTTGFNGTIKLWDAATGQLIKDLYPEGFGANLLIDTSWSPDGKRIVSLASDAIVRIWDATTGDPLKTFDGHVSCTSIHWSPTGERILTSGSDGTVRVWDVNVGVEIARYDVGGSIAEAHWSPDGRYILTAGDDGLLKVFPAWRSLQELIDYAKECWVIRELTAEEREQFGLPPR